MEIKLKDGQKFNVKNITLDERDELLDSIQYDNDGDNIKIKMMHSTMTKFIRTGVKGNIADKFLKELSFADKTEIFTKIQNECMNLGEEKASK